MTLMVAQIVDVEAQTVTLRLEDLGTDSEFNGRPCYAVELDDPWAKRCLRMLGYEHIGCEVVPDGSPHGWRHIEYWVKAGSGGET